MTDKSASETSRCNTVRAGGLMRRAATTAFLALALASCQQQSESGKAEGSAAAESGPKPLKLAFVTNNPSDFWTIARAGVNQAASELPNLTIEFNEPVIAGSGRHLITLNINRTAAHGPLTASELN